jgi:Tfp pilus assembly protein PilO
MSAEAKHATPKAEEAKPGFKPIEEEVFEAKAGRDLGKVALFVALLAVVLMVILYFSQQQSIVELSGKVDEVKGVKQEVTAVKDHVAALEKEVVALQDLPNEVKKIIISGMLKESASKVEHLITQVENAEQQAKLAEIKKMLKDVAAGL